MRLDGFRVARGNVCEEGEWPLAVLWFDADEMAIFLLGLQYSNEKHIRLEGDPQFLENLFGKPTKIPGEVFLIPPHEQTDCTFHLTPIPLLPVIPRVGEGIEKCLAVT